jgi:hypothetical protein
LGGGIRLEELTGRGALVLVEAVVGVLVELIEELAVLLHHRPATTGKGTGKSSRRAIGWRLLGEKGSEKDGGEREVKFHEAFGVSLGGERRGRNTAGWERFRLSWSALSECGTGEAPKVSVCRENGFVPHSESAGHYEKARNLAVPGFL